MSIINLIIVAKYVVVQILIFPYVFNRNSKVQNLPTPIAKLLKKKKLKEKGKRKN